MAVYHLQPGLPAFLRWRLAALAPAGLAALAALPFAWSADTPGIAGALVGVAAAAVIVLTTTWVGRRGFVLTTTPGHITRRYGSGRERTVDICEIGSAQGGDRNRGIYLRAATIRRSIHIPRGVENFPELYAELVALSLRPSPGPRFRHRTWPTILLLVAALSLDQWAPRIGLAFPDLLILLTSVCGFLILLLLRTAWRKRNRWSGAFALLVCVLLAAMFVHEAGIWFRTRAAIGRAAPAFALRSVTGADVALPDYHARPVVVDLWASWCSPCRAELPEIAAWYKSQPGAGRDFELLAVNDGEDAGDVNAYLRDHPLPFPVLLDPDSTVHDAWQAHALPTVYVLDGNGRIRWATVGLEGRIGYDLTRALRLARR